MNSISLIVVAASVALAMTPARADEYPSRPIKIIAPIAAGGPSDTAARLVAQALARHLNQSVVVENRTGAGGVLGTEMVVNATADGYTLLLSIAATFTVIPLSKKSRLRPGEGLHCSRSDLASAPGASCQHRVKVQDDGRSGELREG